MKSTDTVEKARVEVLQKEQAAASRTGTQANQDRKAHISVLITEFERMKVMIDLYRGVLPTFQKFVKKRQHEKPMVHLLHLEMVALTRHLSKFMRPKAILLTLHNIIKLDIRTRDSQLPKQKLSVGQFSFNAMNKAWVQRKVWVEKLRDASAGVRYPTLSKLVRALLSIFTGHLLKGSFNLMNDIRESDRCSMNVETYEGLAVIKSTLKAREWTPSTMSIDQSLRRPCLSSFQSYQQHLKKKKDASHALQQQRLSVAARVLSSKEALKRKRAQPAHIAQATTQASSPQNTPSIQAITSQATTSNPTQATPPAITLSG
ncbi:uncharacterized protein LOC134444070 [Engraulis encrasicolus]|uniref:uncharacterized protein LOC134444070 n=1 Tax=Engraulis encrasicolus TaxID=184585 RepID=UPI002FD7063A